MHLIKTVVFGLDGALIGSYLGIRASHLHAIGFSGSKLRLKKLRSKIGPSISKMIPQIWPDLEPSGTVKVLRRFLIHYNREGCLRSQIYRNVKKALKGLERKIFLLTNKPLRPTRKILKYLKIEVFSDVLCLDLVVPA